MPDVSPLELGAFLLDAQIGRGGMAHVWRGTHRSEGEPVAIKLVTAELARERRFREALQNELRAMARLDHPGVVVVLDYGQVPAAAARASDGELAEGSPYLVMELAEGGTLRREHVGSWPELKARLAALLSALAHAHARGVIHRDLKPSNVLVTKAGELRLSDFGIAHALGRTEAGAVPLSAGTAWFMAPEQILGLHRDEGPWTDLYALGCLAYLMTTHRLPFPGSDRELVYRAHCLADVPPLAPRFAVPEELAPWIGVLLAKSPRDRFELAADALRALEQLGGPMIEPVDAEAAPAADDRTEAMPTNAPVLGAAPSTWKNAATIEASARVEPMAALAPARATCMRTSSVPPIPAELPPLARARPPRLLGIGLGVYGLRPIPLAGRERERRDLWGALARVAEERRASAIVVRGRAGYGKTRLVEWLVELAGERGAGHVLWARHDPTPSAADGVTQMLERHLRTEGLSGAELDQRLRDALPRLGELERAPLAALLSPGERQTMRPEERFAIARDAIAHLARTRPTLLVFDDAQYGGDSIAFVEHLLRTHEGGALGALCVLTIREEALEERAAEREALARLLERPSARELEIGPLSAAEHAQLIADLLGLEENLASRVAARTAGSPLFAVQLVGDWVQRGHLVTGERGFVLRDGVEPEIPDDIHELWSARIDRLVASMPAERREGSQRALAIMALLGRQVARVEWEAACAEAGVEPAAELLEAIALLRLGLVGRHRFTLVHGMLSESLERRAREARLWTSLHAACARMLERLHAGDRAQAERLARHLVEAGRLEDALPALRSAMDARLTTCDFPEARALCAEHQRILDRIGAPADDLRRARAEIAEADVLGTQSLLDECEARLDRAEPIVRSHGARALLGSIARLRGGIRLKRGQIAQSIAFFSEGLALMTELGDVHGQAQCLHGLGECEKLVGRIAASEAAYHDACERFERVGDRLGRERSRMGLADVYRRRGDLDEAVHILESANESMRRMGNRHSEGVGLNSLGDIARIRGQLELAERHYLASLRVFDAIASEEAIIVRLNLALVLLARGASARAREVFESTRPELGQAGREGYLSYTVAGLFAAAAGLHDWAAMEPLYAELTRLLDAVGLVDDDLAFALELAGDSSAAAGERAWAGRAYGLAIAQWRGLGRAERVAAVEGKIDASGLR